MARFIEVEIKSEIGSGRSRENYKAILNVQYIVKAYPRDIPSYSIIEYNYDGMIDKYEVFEDYSELSKKLCGPEEVYVRQNGGYFRCVVEEA